MLAPKDNEQQPLLLSKQNGTVDSNANVYYSQSSIPSSSSSSSDFTFNAQHDDESTKMTNINSSYDHTVHVSSTTDSNSSNNDSNITPDSDDTNNNTSNDEQGSRIMRIIATILGPLQPNVCKFRIGFNIIELLTITITLLLTHRKCLGSTTFEIVLYIYLATTASVLVGLIAKLWLYYPSIFRFIEQISKMVTITAIVRLHTTTECVKDNPPIYIICMIFFCLNILITVLVLLAIVIFCILFPFLMCFSPSFRQLMYPPADSPATQDDIDLLPSFEYNRDTYRRRTGHNNNNDNNNNDDTNDSDNECTICASEYENGDILRRFDCHHDFHQACIDQWLLTKARCPVCREPVFKRDGYGKVIPPSEYNNNNVPPNHTNNNDNQQVQQWGVGYQQQIDQSDPV